MTQPIDISGLPKHKVLRALIAAARIPDIGGVIFFETPPSISDEQAEQLLAENDDPQGWPFSFDYVAGRSLKVDLYGDALNPAAYDRDNGELSAEMAIAFLRAELGLELPQVDKVEDARAAMVERQVRRGRESNAPEGEESVR